MHRPQPAGIIRSFAAVILLGPVLAFAAPTLEERVAALERQLGALLTENQALREQAAKSTPAAAPSVSIGGKESKLILGGFAQIHVESGDAPDSRYAGIHDRFLLRRARLNLRGNFGAEWSFKVEADFGANTLGAASGLRAQMTDGYVDWTPHPSAQVRFGQFKTPFGWDQLMSDTQNPFVERPLVNDRLTVSRQIGAMFFGNTAEKRLDYSAGVFNGNGVNTSNNDNSAFMSVARLAAKVWSGRAGSHAATLGAGVNGFTTRDTGSFTGRRDGFGMDAQLSVGPAAFRAEWLRNTFAPAVGASSAADGWHLAALYDLNRSWQLTTRYETYDPNTAIAGNETDTWLFGFNYRIKGNDLVFTLNYLAGDARPGGRDDRVIGRFQVVF